VDACHVLMCVFGFGARLVFRVLYCMWCTDEMTAALLRSMAPGAAAVGTGTAGAGGAGFGTDAGPGTSIHSLRSASFLRCMLHCVTQFLVCVCSVE